MFYSALQRGPYKVPGYYDKDSKKLFRIIFRPDAWSANTVYRLRGEDDPDCVMPTVDTGVYYKVKSPGKSGSIDPFTGDAPGDEVTDGTLGLIWEAVAYDLMPMDVTVSTVTFAANNSVTLANTSSATTSCQFRVSTVPAAAIAEGVFEVTAHVAFSNGDEDDYTVRFTIGPR